MTAQRKPLNAWHDGRRIDFWASDGELQIHVEDVGPIDEETLANVDQKARDLIAEARTHFGLPLE